MNKAQQKATMNLQSALARCGKVGLTGGVFDTQFCIWPGQDKNPFEWHGYGHGDFFDSVVQLGGENLSGHGMDLDGGAGN